MTIYKFFENFLLINVFCKSLHGAFYVIISCFNITQILRWYIALLMPPKEVFSKQVFYQMSVYDE